MVLLKATGQTFQYFQILSLKICQFQELDSTTILFARFSHLNKMSSIQAKMQTLVLNFIDCLVENKVYNLEVPRNETILSDSRCQIRAYDNPATARKYCQLMSIVALIGEMDATSRHISQRDLYYALKLLFKNQRGCSAIMPSCGT